jgi:hypothetical protein
MPRSNHHAEIEIGANPSRFQPPQRGTEGRAEKETKKLRSEPIWKRRNLWRTFERAEQRGSREGKRNEERKKLTEMKKKKTLNRGVRNVF